MSPLMKLRNRRKWQVIRAFSIGWTLAFVFLCIVRGVGTTEDGIVKFSITESLLFAILIGPVFGAISGYTQVLTEERIYKRITIRSLLIFRLVFAFFFLGCLILASFALCKLLWDIPIGLVAFALEPGSFAIYFYILTVDFFIVAMRQVSLMLGGQNLGKLVMGKFYTPREEARVFMFLDLQSSTQLAEKLGHIAYSQFLQDCFNDLGVTVENEAEIYQYVGDEVILTWPMAVGMRNQNCLRAFFNFKNRLAIRTDYYQEKYGCLPFFKAGVNAGMVTVTEVGKYKKEIAYHGDAINTAARIQGQCNDFRQELLVSGGVKDQLGQGILIFEAMGSILLKGKHEAIPIFAVYNPFDQKKVHDTKNTNWGRIPAQA